MEVRVKNVSMLTIVAHFWCNEGLSSRNWAILQQISALISQYKLPFVMYADFNMPPETITASGWLGEHKASLLLPDVDTTCKGSKYILDYCAVSATLVPFLTIEPVVVPWGPHIGLHVTLVHNPSQVRVRKLVEPLLLPMAQFHENWKNMSVNQKRFRISKNICKASTMLTNHALMFGHAILGHPTQELITDPKFQMNLSAHIQAGELMAQAALQTELLICDVCEVFPTLYIGRSPYPSFQNKAICMKLHLDDKFTSPAANFWGILGTLIDDYSQARSKASAKGIVHTTSAAAGASVAPVHATRKKNSADFKPTVFPIARKFIHSISSCFNVLALVKASLSA